ncbi:class F sortase [Pseudonocardia acaciae]|uniref:class F sortase n=1 Tax=Pseudonocardia acaciae TaxID=551276 RepID=UPI00049043C4|nr:class F sortase [Pseudonocardia acaciae]
MSWRRAALVAVPAALALLLAGCGDAEPGPNDGPTLSAPLTGGPVQAIPPLPASNPTEIKVDKINAQSSLIPTGLNPDRTIATPPVSQPLQASWYRLSPTPGAVGPAIILGHINGGGKDGIFAHLHELKPGDQVQVKREDGKTAIFTITKLEQHSKNKFPTLAVYGDTPEAQIRLITCGGAFNKAAKSYVDNIVASGVLTGVA